MPGGPVPRAPGRRLGRALGRPGGRPRPGWPRRLWHELGSVSGEHDRIVRLIIVERLAKSAVLLALAVSLVAADRLGYLRQLADALQEQLNLAAGHEVIAQVITWVLNELGRLLPRVTVVAIAVTAYAALETVEGIGLWMRRRWAEYLTVLATGGLIPLEVVEVVDRPTPFRLAALLVNVAIVVYLAYRKRLFVDV